MTYVETASDAAFTIWLATRNPAAVAAEAHTHMSKPERQILRYVEQQLPPKPVTQHFTNRQIEIALAAMASRKQTRKAS